MLIGFYSLAWTFCLSLVPSGPKCVSARNDQLNKQRNKQTNKEHSSWSVGTLGCNMKMQKNKGANRQGEGDGELL